MTYALQMTEFSASQNVAAAVGDAGMPSTFSKFSLSVWVCGLAAFTPEIGGIFADGGNDTSRFSVQFHQDFLVIELWSGPQTNPANAIWQAGIYDYPSAPTGTPQNFLISVDTLTNTAKVWVQDVAATLDAGSTPWNSAVPVDNPGNYPAVQWTAGGAPANPGIIGMGDLWFDIGTAIDFDIEANRRKFINADLTPVDLGSSGATPTGSSPITFLHIAGSVADDFATNHGSGPAWSVFGGPLVIDAACTPSPPPEPPGVPVPFCGDVHTTTSFTASWTPTGAGATSYTLDWRKVGDVSFTEVTGITDTFLLITGLTPGTTYEFKVKALNDTGESAFSDLVECSTLTTGIALSMDNVIVQSLLTESPCTASQFSPPPDVTPSWGLRWSDTRGATFGNAVPQEFTSDPLGQPQWNRTGMARDRVCELFWSAAYQTAINGAFIQTKPLKS